MADSMNKNHDMILGEMRGQLREVVHSVNNLSGKFDALTREVVALGPLAVQIAEIKAKVEKLETTNLQQTGAKNLVVWFLQSPLFAWVAAAVAFFFAVLWRRT
jgi:hypothetical protein